MGQPSFQASNVIIYLTYGAFLYVKPHRRPHRPTTLTSNVLTTKAFGPLRSLALEEPVQESFPGDESYPEGLDTT